MKPSIHKDGNDVVLCATQLMARQRKQPDFVAAILAEATRNADGDYVIPHARMLELLKVQVTVAREWPKILLPLKLLARPGDKGLGDIIARTIGPIGGDAYKAWFQKTFGRSCGCTERQDQLNQKYPL